MKIEQKKLVGTCVCTHKFSGSYKSTRSSVQVPTSIVIQTHTHNIYIEYIYVHRVTEEF